MSGKFRVMAEWIHDDTQIAGRFAAHLMDARGADTASVEPLDQPAPLAAKARQIPAISAQETEALAAVMRRDPDRVQDLLGGMTPQQLLQFSEHVERLWHAIRRARWGGGASS